MRKLTESEIAKKRDMVDELWNVKAIQEAELNTQKLKLKSAKHQLVETDRDIRTLMSEILSGETEDNQMELPE